jgi:hypothetical protein
MERINDRRAARGQEQLVNSNNDEEEYYEDQPETKPKAQRGPAFPSKRPSTLDAYKGQKSLGERMAERGSMKDEAKARTEEFRKKFKPEGSMGIEKSVGSEAEKLKRNRGMGISTPSYLQGSYNRIGATA